MLLFNEKDRKWSYMQTFIDYMKFLIGLLILLLAVLYTISCRHEDEPKPHDTTTARTVLVYMVAENSLSSFATLGVNGQPSDCTEMLTGISAMSDNDRMVIYLDALDTPRIYVLTNKTKATSFQNLKPEHIYDEEMNSASPETFKMVLEYVTKKYTADEYGLVMWSHGSGWIPSTYDESSETRRRSFGIDNGYNIGGNNSRSNRGPQMEIKDMATTMSRFPKFEFVYFDACFMQCIEVAYELRLVTNHIIASPAETPGYGAPYDQLMPSWFADKVDYQAMIDTHIAHYKTYMGSLMSVIDCTKLDMLATATRKAFSGRHDALLAIDYSKVQNYFSYDRLSRYFPLPDCYDMRGIMMQLLTGEEYDEWFEAFEQAVPIRQCTSTWYSLYPDANLPVDTTQYGGVTMFVPLEKYMNMSFYEAYQKTEWAKNVWN